MAFWNKSAETVARKDLNTLQIERLQSTLINAYENVPFYRDVFLEKGIKPKDICSLEDLVKFPFTVKDNLRENYPYGMFAVPLSEVVRIHSSSGTTGRPTVVGYTRNDLKSWSELIARMMVAVGVTKDDVIQISFGYGLFTGGFGLHYGGELVGAAVIPVSSGNTARQIMIMKDYGTTTLVSTPSYSIYLAEAMKDEGVNPNDLKLRIGMFGGEPWSEAMRAEIESRLPISATDNYGLSEVMGPGVSFECEYKDGMHISEDHFIAEIIDPETGEVLPPGSQGELVITTLTREALPILRYRTRDITTLIPEQCRCGRTFTRMTKPFGRTDDMLIIRGVNIFPSQIESVLMEIEEAEPHYQLVVTRDGALDNLEVLVEINEKVFFDEMKKMKTLEDMIRNKIRSTIGLGAKVKLVEPKTLERSDGKAQRVIDKRKIL